MATKDIEEAVYKVLTASATLTALVSTRIYPFMLPQEIVLPAIVFFRTSGLRTHVMGGDLDLIESRVQVSIWAGSLLATRTISDAVRTLLQRWRGNYDNLAIHDSLLDSEYDDYNDDVEGYECVHEYRIFHSYAEGLPMFPSYLTTYYLGMLLVDPDTAGWGAADEGKVWYNTTDHHYKTWNGTEITQM